MGIVPKTESGWLAQQALMMSWDLRLFVKQSWHLIEPAKSLVWGGHLDAICDHLQAVSAGQIKRLLINIPPRTSKSSITSVLWPCWEWITQPGQRWLCSSYALDLSLRDSLRRRYVLTSEWFERRWPALRLVGKGGVRHEGGQDHQDEFHNTRAGSMVATSVGGAVTGRGGDRLLQDDPHDATAMESEAVRRTTLQWYDLKWSTRKNDLAKSAEVIIMQRTHPEDMTGHVLSQGGWTHLKLPMERTSVVCETALPWRDWRAAEGEILDPVRFPRAELDRLKLVLGPYGVASQLQQEPVPLGGGLIKSGWLGRWRPSDRQAGYVSLLDGLYQFDPMTCLRFATVDPAATEATIGQKKLSDPDYTVIAVWCVFMAPQGPLVVLLDLVRERMEAADILPRIEAVQARWRCAFIGLETIAFQLLLFQEARRRGLPVREISTKKRDDVLYTIDTDKVGRVMAAVPLMASGRFFVPEYSPWLADFLKEVHDFPNGSHDDMVDCVAYACAIAEKHRGILPSYGASSGAVAEGESPAEKYRRAADDPVSDGRVPLAGFFAAPPEGHDHLG